MRTLTLEQLRTATATGGVIGVTLRALGSKFIVEVNTSGGAVVLAHAHSSEPRHFATPGHALNLLHTLGLHTGQFDTGQLDTGQGSQQTQQTRSRPDRTQLKREYEAAGEADEYDKWFREEVMQSLAEADDPAAEWIPHEVVMADTRRQRESILQSLSSQAE